MGTREVSPCLSTSRSLETPRSNQGNEPPQLASLGWALRRAALWFAMMFAMVVVGLWLFYASIDPDEASAGPVTSGETTQTTR